MRPEADRTPDSPNERLGPRAATALTRRHVDAGRRVAVVLLVEPARVHGPTPRLVVASDGSVSGSLGSAALDHEAEALARNALSAHAPRQGLATVAESSGVETRLFVEVHQPTPDLVIVGAGHIAQPLSTVGQLLGFRVLVLDDRPEFATLERFPGAYRVQSVDFSDPFAGVPIGPASHFVLVTRGHKYDYECLRRLTRADPQPAYIGMIGSRRRVRATYVQLLDEGVDRTRLLQVRAPVGLDIGAETPAEIAVSVGAELVQSWRGGSGEPLSGRERILERFFTE